MIVNGVLRKQRVHLLFDAGVLRERQAELAWSAKRLTREANYVA